MGKLNVYFRITQEKNHIEADEENDNLDHCWTTVRKELEMKQFSTDNIQKAFDEEDGDGDETGSWSKGILLITNEKGTILYDPSTHRDNTERTFKKDRFLEACKYKALKEVRRKEQWHGRKRRL